MTTLSEELLARYGRREVPRYTSYPTAPHFRPADDSELYRRWLGEVPTDEPVSLYLHVPFCRAMCWYCGCHTSVTRREEPVARYVETMKAEIDLVAAALPARMKVAHVHFGGGTPTVVTPAEFSGLMERLRERFDLADDAEVAIEIDPRTLAPAMVRALAEGGVNRASLGVQSFDLAVQKAINRIQPYEQTRDAVERLRAAGIQRINLDLIYGLPEQTVASCRDTVEKALSLAPDRLAVFGYAHVPNFKRHQRKIDTGRLPDSEERLAQADAIASTLVAGGLVAIGLDHFAAPEDELALAAESGELHRNFQGYTTDDCRTLIGFGASAIGQLPSGFVQNAVLTGDYQRRIADGKPALARHCPTSADDRLRAAVIERLMCDYRVDLGALCAPFGVDPARLSVADRLDRLAEDGVVRVTGDLVEVSADARALVRNVAAAFDCYFDEGGGRHARAV